MAGEYCNLVPQVRNERTGRLEDSILFSELLDRLDGDHSAASRIWRSLHDVTARAEIDALERNEQGEPTFESLLTLKRYADIFPEASLMSEEGRRAGFTERDGTLRTMPDTQRNRDELQERADRYNTEHPDGKWVALICEGPGAKGWGIGVQLHARGEGSAAAAGRQAANVALNARIRAALSANGVRVGALTELEQRMGVNGVTEFDKAQAAAAGIVTLIRLARGERGEAALPEEFAHFAVACLSDSELVRRLVNETERLGLAREALGDGYEAYAGRYGTDTRALAEEAVGKMLAEELLREQRRQMQPGIARLFGRFADLFRERFSRMDADGLERAAADVRRDVGLLAREILAGQHDADIRPERAAAGRALYSLDERIDRDRRIVTEMKANTEKRMAVYGKRNSGKDYVARQKEIYSQLEAAELHGNFLEGILGYLRNCAGDMDNLLKRFDMMDGAVSRDSLNLRARTLRNIRDMIMSYAPTLRMLRDALDDEDAEVRRALKDDGAPEEERVSRYDGEIAELIDATTLALERLRDLYRKSAMPLFVEFVRPYIGDSIVVPFGKEKGKVITAEELVQYADRDISFFDRWLDSMADSPDMILKVYDRERKLAFERQRLQDIEDVRELELAGARLKEATGSDDQSFMFARDGEGRLNGFYINDIDAQRWRDAYNVMMRGLKRRFGRADGPNADAFEREKERWMAENTDVMSDGTRRPKRTLYGSAEWLALSDGQRAFYDAVMTMKRRKDRVLPPDVTTELSAVKIHKDIIERLRDGKGIGETFLEEVRDAFVRRCDDTDLGVKTTLVDFEGKEVNQLPIFYIGWKDGEDFTDLSTDVVSTMAAYCSMANSFEQMNRVIDIMELGRALMSDPETGRKIPETSGLSRLLGRFGKGRESYEEAVYKNPAAMRFMERLNDFFDMQVYNRYVKDEGSVLGVEVSKMADWANQLTALHVFALNLLAGISNVATGTVMMRIDSVCGEFFSPRNVRHGDATYASELPGVCDEIGQRVRTSKLALFDELFNVLQDHEERMSEINWDRVSRFARLCSTNTLYFLSNCGEHWMQNRTALSLADTVHFMDGESQITLWDAYSVEPVDGKDLTKGGRLVMKRGLKDSDGRTVVTRQELRERARERSKAYTKRGIDTMSEGTVAADSSLLNEGEVSEYDLISRFTARSAAINERLHGVYNKLDRNALQQFALGRMAMMFRKWMKPSFNRRFESMKYNFDLDEWTEGYYVTTFRFAGQLLKDIRQCQLDVAATWASLHPTERANIRRAGVELAHFLAICAAVGIFGAMYKDKDRKDMPWAVRMLEYQLLRLQNEVGVLTPSPLMFGEFKQIMQTPMAAINTFETSASLTKMLWLPNWFDEIQAGPYKGHSSAYRAYMNSPLFPFGKTLNKWAHPERASAFYKQNN